MKIVVLDGYAMNPGDLEWDKIEQYGELTVHDRTPEHLILDRCRDAEMVLTNKVPLREDVIAGLSSLKYIGVLATGYNVVDIEAARKRGIPVTNVPGYSTDSVAQLTFSFILELCYRTQRHSDLVREGRWADSPDFSFWDYPLIEISGKTIGVIGFGTIGEKVADIANAFGMKILGNRRNRTDQSHRPNFQWAEVDEILEESDVVSLHCPLIPETEGMINRQSLRRMKESAFLINTARGPLIVEEDLAEALKSGWIAGAGLDVLSSEPPPHGHPLVGLDNCIITPHIGWASKEARTRLMEIVSGNLEAYLAGNPRNVVNEV